MEDDRRAHSGKRDIDPGHWNLQARRELVRFGPHEEGAVNHDDGEKKNPEKMNPELWKPQRGVVGISWLTMARSASRKSRLTRPRSPVSS